MAKLLDKTLSISMIVLGVITAIGIGGLFMSGVFMNVWLLKLLPLIVHKVVGVALIATAILGVVAKLFK